MDSRLFDVFCEMIDRAPADAVLVITEAQRRMFENDLAMGRAEIAGDSASILGFCRFLHSTFLGRTPSAESCPPKHVAFYRNTVERLIESGHLQPAAKAHFDKAYRESLKQALGPAFEETPELRILHLEDDPLDGELVELRLRDLNVPFTIRRAATEDAFEASLQNEQFDVVLSDSSLPGFDTLKAVGVARQRFPGIPFVFLSGNTNPVIKAETLRRGATDYVDKDDLGRLVEVIRRVCVQKKAPAQA